MTASGLWMQELYCFVAICALQRAHLERMLPDRKQYPYSHWPISHAQLAKKNQPVGEIFQEFLAFSILSWKIVSSKCQLILLNPYILILWDLQLSISDKKAFSYTFNRVKCHINRVLEQLILRFCICLRSSHIQDAKGQVAIPLVFRDAEQFQLSLRCQGYLRGKNYLYNKTNPKTANQISQNSVE